MILGAAYWDVDGAPKDPREKGEGAFKRRRDLIKTLVYMLLYGGSVQRAHQELTAVEDSHGNLIYTDITERDVRRMERRWKSAAPEFPLWWKKCVESYRRDGYIQDPVWGLRRYFANGEDQNEIVNFGVQAGGGAIVHEGMLALCFGENGEAPAVPFTEREGLVLQMHDSLDFLVKEDRAEAVAAVVTEKMSRRFPGLDVAFTAAAKIGQKLGAV